MLATAGVSRTICIYATWTREKYIHKTKGLLRFVFIYIYICSRLYPSCLDNILFIYVYVYVLILLRFRSTIIFNEMQISICTRLYIYIHEASEVSDSDLVVSIKSHHREPKELKT